MEQLRVEPNAHSYCAAIAAHEDSARWRDALGLLAAMKARASNAHYTCYTHYTYSDSTHTLTILLHVPGARRTP